VGGILVKTTGTRNRTTTVALDGVVGGAATNQLRRTLVDVILRGKPNLLVIDLERVTGLDAEAVGVLRAAGAAASDAGVAARFSTLGSPLAAALDRDGIRHGRQLLPDGERDATSNRR
jgi:anti-anti-sigma regulatory factor